MKKKGRFLLILTLLLLVTMSVYADYHPVSRCHTSADCMPGLICIKIPITGDVDCAEEPLDYYFQLGCPIFRIRPNEEGLPLYSCYAYGDKRCEGTDCLYHY